MASWGFFGCLCLRELCCVCAQVAVWTALWNLVCQEEREAALLLWDVVSLFCLLLPLGLRSDNMALGIAFFLDVVAQDVEKLRTARASFWV